MGRIFGRIVSQAEKGFAHLRCRRFSQRSMPGGHAAQPLQAVINWSIQRQHVQLALDQRDEGQEVLTVEAVLIKFTGRPI